MLAEAGPAAEGFQAVFPYDPSRNDARWLDFNRRFNARFKEQPEQFAALAYDAMNMLLDSICKAGLNRARIHDALADIEQYDGITGPMRFDPNQKNVAPMYLGTVHDGTITYKLAAMEKPLAAANTSAPAANTLAAATRTGPVQPPLSAAPQVPYARIDDEAQHFNGPHTPDPPQGPVSVVLFGPQASRVAQSAEVQAQLAPATKNSAEWKLIPIDSDQSWGASATQLVHALMDEHALAILALDRNAAHLSEQLALKAFVPVVALSGDKSLTSANVPWIFRLPTESTPADALHLVRTAAARGGVNPERVRDVLASGAQFDGIAFLPTGELRGQ
jgi:hypothetical protein